MASQRGISDFVAEATEILDGLARDLGALEDRGEAEPDPDQLNAIFRAAHSLKGLAGMFGQEQLAALAHSAEDLLDRLRLGRVEATARVLEALTESVDLLQALLAAVARDPGASDPGTGEDVAARARELGRRLEVLSTAAPAGADDPLERLGLPAPVRAVLTEYEEHRLRENLRRGFSLWKVRAVYDLSDFDQRLWALNARLKPLGEVISTLPSSEAGEASRIAFDLVFGTRESRAEVEEAAAAEGATVGALGAAGPPASAPRPSLHAVDRLPRPPSLVPREVTSSAPATTRRPRGDELSLRSLTQTVRVDIRRLDGLMNSVGELLLVKANLQRLAEAARLSGAPSIAKLWGQELGREVRSLERKLDDLQEGLLEARMVPLALVFEKLGRLVRRIARENGKEIEFSISGADVELDKLLVEELSDPLMHIIRNAIDHGVEPPEERVRAGKPRRGAVAVAARQQGNHVLIEVSDDGRGLDEERIREVAVRRRLLSREEASSLGHREVQSLIFLPGFSTAKSVSDLSGRGVGLDVVKTNIANLSGIIDVTSAPGLGTSMVITLPVTLAIIRALVVAASGRTYAVPLNSVVEILSVTSTELKTVERQEVLSVRGQTIPFVRLARMFGLPDRSPARHFVVIVGLAQERLGIGVDELAGQQDVVIKPLGGRLRQLPGIAGATDLGNRRIVLVLDVGALISEALHGDRRAEAGRRSPGTG